MSQPTRCLQNGTPTVSLAAVVMLRVTDVTGQSNTCVGIALHISLIDAIGSSFGLLGSVHEPSRLCLLASRPHFDSIL
jgi:hypothetical protein